MAFSHLNINSIRNKFVVLSEQVRGNIIDVLMVYFPIGNFLILGFSPSYMLDCDSKGDKILLYIKKDSPSNFLKTDKETIESLLRL